MNNNVVLCKSCIKWVDCTKKNGRPIGFCLEEELFTHTEKTVCDDYVQGNPIPEKVWEECEEDENLFDSYFVSAKSMV